MCDNVTFCRQVLRQQFIRHAYIQRDQERLESVFSPGGGGGGGGGHSTHTNVALNPLISFARKRWRAVQQKSPTRGRLVPFNYEVLLDVNLAALRCDVCVACKHGGSCPAIRVVCPNVEPDAYT